MRIGIIGSGNIGGALTGLLARAGHEVAVANTRGPESLADLVRESGPGARAAASAAEAAAFGDVVVIAVPFKAYRDLPADRLAGKVVVDANNYYPDRDGRIPELDENRTTSSELVAAALPGARVVKAFNTIYSRKLADDGKPQAPAAERLAIPVAADDAEAKAVVSRLIEEIGFAPVDAGALGESRRQQPGAPVYGAMTGPVEAARLLTST